VSNVEDLMISQIVPLIRTGQLSSVEVVEAILRRIDVLEASLHAWVTIDREAVLTQARQRDEELRQSGPRGPLHGIPVGCKDILYTAGLKTTACSRMYADFVPAYDATAVSRLKQAGAIILGKTVCTEFAVNDPPPTCNAWNRAHTPGGSSSGSAVAVATQMCFATVDTQTAGDILRPAAYNGVVGFKPTYGRISRYGVMPVAWSLDTVGMLTRSIEDAALLLQVLAGPDPHDPSASSSPISDYTASLATQHRAPRLGLVRQYFYEHADQEVRAHTDQVVEALRQAGAQIEEVVLPIDLTLLHAAHRIIVSSECAAYHQERFVSHPEDYGSKLREFLELGMVTPVVPYLQAQRLRQRFRRTLQAAFERVDALLTPATPSVAPADHSTTGSPLLQIPWTLCGFPTLALPSGLSAKRMPLGLQFVGQAFREELLLTAAHWCERALHLQFVPPFEEERGEVSPFPGDDESFSLG
jgi:aspartyl-tRNA(Asn)/glutamyl-tRNA(Gln) amidotransferase subunit A